MLPSVISNSFLVIAVLVFVAVTLLLEGLYLLWRSHKGPEAKKIRKRMRVFAAAFNHSPQTQVLKKKLLSEVSTLERLLFGLPWVEGPQRLLHQSGLEWTVSRLLLTCAGFGLAGYLAMAVLLHQAALFSLALGAASVVMPWLYVIDRRRRRFVKLEQQLPDALDLMVRALRAGHAFSSSLKMVGEEMPDPIAGEFRIAHDEVNFGVSLQQALMNMSERLPITDLRYFVVAVMIQRESGGNLTEILGNLSQLIRARLKLLAKIRVLSSEGRLSAWILVLMPFALAGVMYMMNPEFMSPLWKDPIGIGIIEYMLSLMAIGVLILRKIIKIRV
ncbi:MAG TPA: type II secretion system F family protein [Burkholderiaceae bacterium]|nr:type II secretion system F family protein [Burkholderiaceae bacterium]